jgi:hypothetical protein
LELPCFIHSNTVLVVRFRRICHAFEGNFFHLCLRDVLNLYGSLLNRYAHARSTVSHFATRAGESSEVLRWRSRASGVLPGQIFGLRLSRKRKIRRTGVYRTWRDLSKPLIKLHYQLSSLWDGTLKEFFRLPNGVSLLDGLLTQFINSDICSFRYLNTDDRRKLERRLEKAASNAGCGLVG